MLTIDTADRIAIDGVQVNLAVFQTANGTVVFTPECRITKQPYVEHLMPHKRYALSHNSPSSGAPGRAQFESDIRALIERNAS